MERLTPCCKAVAEYTEGVLCCQVCYEEVSHEEMIVGGDTGTADSDKGTQEPELKSKFDFGRVNPSSPEYQERHERMPSGYVRQKPSVTGADEDGEEDYSVTHGFEWRGQPFTLTQTPPPPVIPIRLDNAKGD